MKVPIFLVAVLKFIFMLTASVAVISCSSTSNRVEQSTQLGDELLASIVNQSKVDNFDLNSYTQTFLQKQSDQKLSAQQIVQITEMYEDGTLASISNGNFETLTKWKDNDIDKTKSKLSALLALYPAKASVIAKSAENYAILGKSEVVELLVDANLDPTLNLTSTAAGDVANINMLPKLSTVDNKFVQENGTAVTLKGVSLCSLAWHKPLDQIEQVTHPETGWSPKILRLPVQPRMWEIEGAGPYMRKRIDPAIELCNENGVYCIIDWHKIGNWTDPEVNEELMNFWSKVAPRYANNPNVLYEVFNEPTRPKARTQENWDAYREYAQTWVDHIRNYAPDTVILVGSPHWSQSSSFAVNNPVIGKNIGYVTHVYPLWKPSRWDGLFGNAAEKIPMILTEWGWSSVNQNPLLHASQESFGEPLQQFLDARPHIGWTAWSYDPRCGPAMLGEDTEMAEFVKKWLTQ